MNFVASWRACTIPVSQGPSVRVFDDGHQPLRRISTGGVLQRSVRGNSNWRGPVWFPVNYLLIESLQKFHYYLGESFRVEYRLGSGQKRNLAEVAAELSRRLTHTFCGARMVGGRCMAGRRSFSRIRTGGISCCSMNTSTATTAPARRYHQTGWTGLVAKLIQQSGE